MHICIEGCAHGDLDNIYGKISQYEQQTGKKIDLLICCGDFQATRNKEDLACMAVPQKYLEMGSFYKYYSGQLVAPVLTIFIGGNHEASNHLQELAYGGWVATNIYYLGYAGVISVNGIKIAGISGIYRDYLYNKGHFEFPPYDDSTVRSAYAVRSLEVFRLKQMRPSTIDIMLSHDWPQKIWEYGNRNMQFGSVEGLLRLKPAFKADMDSGKLGSPPCMELLKTLKPRFWYAAHMHCRFDALVPHSETESTKFVALDKCLPRRNYFEFMELGEPVRRDEAGNPIITLQYDPEWLAILTTTNRLLNISSSYTKLPEAPSGNQSLKEDDGKTQRWNFTPTDKEIDAVMAKMNGDLEIKHNFKQTVEAFDPQWDRSDFRNLKQPEPRENIQTKEFCNKLSIDDPLFCAASSKKVKVISIDYNSSNDDAFKEYNETEGNKEDAVQVSQSTKKISALKLPKPVNDEEINLDDLDDGDEDHDEQSAKQEEEKEDEGKPLEHSEQSLDSQRISDSLESKECGKKQAAPENNLPAAKKFKRRNQEIYATNEDDD